MRPLQYLLDENGEPAPADPIAWAMWMDTADRQVALDVYGTASVSTIFLGLDHNHYSTGPPVLWETMVFGGALNGECQRYTSKLEALIGHQEMCERMMALDPPG